MPLVEVSMDYVIELVQVAWVEITMFACAAFVYLLFSGGLARATNSKARKANKLVKNKDGPAPASDVQTLQETLRYKSVEATVELMQAHGGDGGKLLDTAIAESLQRKDFDMIRRLYKLSRALSSTLSMKSLEACARAHYSDPVVLRSLVDDFKPPLSKAFAKTVLQACAALKNTDLVFEVFEKASSADTSELREFVEKKTEAANGPDVNKRSAAGCNSAFKQVRACGKQGDLAGAITLFEKELKKSESKRSTTFLFNSIIEACIGNNEHTQVTSFFARAKSAGTVDVVSYNLVMKSHLMEGNIDRAEEVLEELLQSDIRANESSFHGLLNAHMTGSGNANAAWRVVDRMCASAVKPNAVTCSILLKSVSVHGRAKHVRRVMGMIDTLDSTLDDVLLSSAVDACMTTGQLPLLAKLLAVNCHRSDGVALSAPTYGSMIKAFGQTGDIATVGNLWKDMTTRKVEPTETTLGCMVEALVSNNRHTDACELVEQTWGNENQRSLINTVIYSTLLKGLGRQPAKAMMIYEEMNSRGIPCNLISYNTLLNSLALNGTMDSVPRILSDMANANPPVAPDIVTFSTLIKGFCSCGDLTKALELFEDMKKDGNHKLDEVVYNSLLDGCAKEQRVDDLLKLVAEMKEGGVVPSNYTLSMLVKCLGRCRRLAQAFSLVESITKEYDFKLNIQVYTCLIQACFQNRKLARAIALLDQLESDGLRADEKVFTVLVRGCLQAGNTEKAVEMVRRAFQGKWPVGVEARTIEDVTSKLGRHSDASRELLAEIDASRRQRVENPNPVRRSCNAAPRTSNTVKAGERPNAGFATAKKVPARQSASSAASTTSGTASGSGSDSGC